jgi:hypothetical protein
MLLNHEEIAPLAWLDSVCFDKEDLLFVSDASPSTANQECLCRLSGNLLFVLSIGTSGALKHSFFNPTNQSILSDQRHHLPESVLIQNQRRIGSYCDQLQSNDNRFARFGDLLWQVSEQTAQLLHSEPTKDKWTSDSSCSVAVTSNQRKVLYTLVLEECGVRRCQDTSKHEFSVHFVDALQPIETRIDEPLVSTTRSLRFTCHSKSQCNDWISSIRCANHSYVRSLLFVLQRRCQLARHRQSKLIRQTASLSRPSVDCDSKSIDSEPALPDQSRLSGCSPPPPIHCSGDIDSSTDSLGILLPLGRWILPEPSDSTSLQTGKVNTRNKRHVRSVHSTSVEPCLAFTLKAEVLLYFRQGQLPALQAQVSGLQPSGGSRNSACQSAPFRSSSSSSSSTSSSDTRPLPTHQSPSQAPLSQWQETSEIQSSLSACFAKRFHVPLSTLNCSSRSTDRSDCVSIDVQLFDVIERLTNTRVVLGHSRLRVPSDWITCSVQGDSSPSQTTVRAQLHSPRPSDPIIGSISIAFCADRLPVTLPSSDFADDSLSMHNATCGRPSSGVRSSSVDAIESSAVHCLPNLHNTHLFLNTIYRSFQFELPPLPNSPARKLTITELMVEPTLALLLPQTIM